MAELGLNQGYLVPQSTHISTTLDHFLAKKETNLGKQKETFHIALTIQKHTNDYNLIKNFTRVR